MAERPYDLVSTPEGMAARIRLRGPSVLVSPLLNRGTAFTHAEREALGLTGLLPEGVSTIEGHLRRVYAQYLHQPDDLDKYIFLSHVRDRNEVLFYRLLTEHIEEMLPIVYTPTVGTAIERYSLEYGRPRGVYLSVDHPEQVETAFRNYGLEAEDVDLVVATDAEGVLGIGDRSTRLPRSRTLTTTPSSVETNSYGRSAITSPPNSRPATGRRMETMVAARRLL